MNFKALVTIGLLALAGCAAPNSGLNVSPEAAEALQGKTSQDVFPRISSKSFISAFKTVCERNISNLNTVPSVLKSMGYLEIGTADGVRMFVELNGKPAVGLIGDTPSKIEMCMILAPGSKSLETAVNGYVDGLPGANRIPLTGIIDGARNGWTVGFATPRIYITVQQSDPELGVLFALGVGPA